MKKCAHDACQCQGNELQEDGYCSPDCRDGKTDNGKCACGHSDCR